MDAGAALRAYVDLLLRWNARINLTAARTADAVALHIDDSRAAAAHVPAGARRLVDVGSGAGFPGLVIAVVRPDVAVTLLEPVHKKRAFLAAAIRELGLANARAVAQRLEDHPDRDYDVAVSRATWAADEWIRRARPYVRPGGVVLAMEGRERIALPAGARRHPYRVGERDRAIVVVPVGPGGSAGD